jgi:hypothetical protein
LDDDELAEAKNLFPKDTDFRKLEPRITIDDHRFSEALDFNIAIFLNEIKFTNCLFKQSVDFRDANFELEASFSDSEFLDEVNFGQA